jgi:hypothetical protein
VEHRWDNTRPLAFLVVALAVLYPGVAAGQSGIRLIGSISAGFDSFQEKYSIVDHDTLDSVTEFRTQASLGLLTGTFLRDFLLLEGRAQYGDDTYETAGRLKFTKRLFTGVSRIGLEGVVSRRAFGPNSSYQFPNDYDRVFVRGYFKQSLGRALAIRVTDRLEYQDFERRTEFDYDYRRNRTSVAGEFDWNLTTFFDMQVSYVTMDIPDSTEIEYESFIPSLEFRYFAGLYQRLNVSAALERRDYVAGSPRSSFWSILGSLTAEWLYTAKTSLLLESDLEWYDYDFKDPVYFDYVENRTALLIKFNHSYALSVGVGPTVGVLASDISDQDEYKEFGAKLAAEYNRGATVWVSFAYEPGKRTYESFRANALDQELSLFSDYSYHRLSMFANVRVWRGLTFGAFVDYQPEDHKREGDDATATLISISLNYVF